MKLFIWNHPKLDGYYANGVLIVMAENHAQARRLAFQEIKARCYGAVARRCTQEQRDANLDNVMLGFSALLASEPTVYSEAKAFYQPEYN